MPGLAGVLVLDVVGLQPGPQQRPLVVGHPLDVDVAARRADAGDGAADPGDELVDGGVVLGLADEHDADVVALHRDGSDHVEADDVEPQLGFADPGEGGEDFGLGQRHGGLSAVRRWDVGGDRRGVPEGGRFAQRVA